MRFSQLSLERIMARLSRGAVPVDGMYWHQRAAAPVKKPTRAPQGQWRPRKTITPVAWG